MSDKRSVEYYTSKSPKAKELADLISEQWYDEHEFQDKRVTTIGILMDCDTDEKRQKMIDILKEWIISVSDMIELATQIKEGKTPKISKL